MTEPPQSQAEAVSVTPPRQRQRQRVTPRPGDHISLLTSQPHQEAQRGVKGNTDLAARARELHRPPGGMEGRRQRDPQEAESRMARGPREDLP